MSGRVQPHFTAGWWVLTHQGWLPWLRVAGLTTLAVELYGLLLRIGEPAEVTVLHPGAGHAILVVRDWSLVELGKHLGNTPTAAVLGARRELEERQLVALLCSAGEDGERCNAYAVVTPAAPTADAAS